MTLARDTIIHHRPGELFVKFGNECKEGVAFPLPPPFPFWRGSIPIPMPLPANPLPLLGLVPPCHVPVPSPYPKGAESLRALESRLGPAVDEDSSEASELSETFSLEVRCRFELPRPSFTSPSNISMDAEPGLEGSGVDVVDPG